MTTNKPRVLLTIGKDLLEKIEDFRFDNRISSRSKAIRRLLEEALKRYEKKTNRKKSND
jgi:metal-responsive CopG/Arc/MetJ family transcriptional regulator